MANTGKPELEVKPVLTFLYNKGQSRSNSHLFQFLYTIHRSKTYLGKIDDSEVFNGSKYNKLFGGFQ